MEKIKLTTPKADGFRMPAEFEPQERIWMIWPQRGDIWRDGGKPVQKAIADLAKTISKYTAVTMGVSDEQYDNCCAMLGDDIQVVEITADDSWTRDTGPAFLINDSGELRACDWKFNAWGGFASLW